jgi:hypothetical protein
MVIEKTRVKEVVENINPAKLNEYFQLKGIDVKLKKGNIMDVLEEIHHTEAFLELHKIYFFNQAQSSKSLQYFKNARIYKAF